MNRKRVLSIALATALVFVVACSNDAGVKEEENGGAQTPPAEGAKDPGASSGAETPAAAPEEPATIEVERGFSVSVDIPPPEQDVILQTIRKDLNIDLKYAFTFGKSDDWRAKMGARVAANDLPEAIMYFNLGDYRKAQADGYLLPLNDVFNLETMPANIKSYVTEGMLYYITDPNGEYHGLPSRPPSLSNGLFIRKDWLEKLDLAMPTTTDELKDVMIAFANRDPDGNGKKDTYAFSASGSSMQQQLWWQFLSAFTGDVRGTYWVDDAGALRGGLASPEMRQYLQFMHDLMKEGALDPDFATNTLDRVTQKVEQGQVGIFYNAGYPTAIVDNMKTINPNADVVVLPPVTGPAGQASNNGKTIAPNGVLGITVKLKDQPEKVRKIIELVDWMTGDVGEELLTFGAEGVSHKKTNGVVTEFIAGKESNYLAAYSLVGTPALKEKPEAVKVFYPDPFLYEQQMMLLGDRPKYGSVFALGQAKEPTELAADLNKYAGEMMMKFIYGNVPLDDANWNEYVETYMTTYKGQEYLDIVTAELKKNGVLK